MSQKVELAQKDVLKDYLDSLLQDIPAVTECQQPPPLKIAADNKRNHRGETTEAELSKDADSKDREIIPVWAKTQFQSLLFTAGGLKLSIPLIRSNGILAWNSVDLTPMPGHRVWFLGVVSHHGKFVKVIDVFNFVTPANYKVKPAKDRLQNIVLIDDANWGLACDSIAGTLTLSQESVRWRTANSKRPWLSGTIIDQMCALLDPDEFVRLLSKSQRNE